MSQDIVADALNQIMNMKKAKKKQIVINSTSKFLLKILDVIKELGYIDYKTKEKQVIVEIKKLNYCSAIKPRYNVSADEIEKYVRRFLPAKDFGYLIISTSKGLMTHEEAIEKNIGGSLIDYVY